MMKSFFIGLVVVLCTTGSFAADPIENSITVLASPLQAWRAMSVDWQVRQWTGAATAYFEIREGGPWRVTYEDGSLEEGLFELAEPGNALVYSFLHDGHGTRVEIRFRALPEGTEVAIKHSKFGAGRNGDGRRSELAEYWETRLPALSAYLDRVPGSYLARPRIEGAYPAVLLLHDRFGLNRTTRDFADSLARKGYIALAIDMFKGDVTSDPAQGARFLELVNNEESIAAARDGFDFLRKDDGVLRRRIAVWGFGYGGSTAMHLSAQIPNLKLCVNWYGHDVPPREQLPRIAARVFGVFAGADPSIPPHSAQSFNQQLVQAGISAETIIVQGSDGFADPSYGVAFRPSAIIDAWRQTLIRLDRTLKL